MRRGGERVSFIMPGHGIKIQALTPARFRRRAKQTFCGATMRGGARTSDSKQLAAARDTDECQAALLSHGFNLTG